MRMRADDECQLWCQKRVWDLEKVSICFDLKGFPNAFQAYDEGSIPFTRSSAFQIFLYIPITTIILDFWRRLGVDTSNKTSNISSNSLRMPDFLTRRNGTWHFARRVPVEFARSRSARCHQAFDSNSRSRAIALAVAPRGWPRNSTRSSKLLEGSVGREHTRSNLTLRGCPSRARAMGFEYIEYDQLLQQPPKPAWSAWKRSSRRGWPMTTAPAALLGTEKTAGVQGVGDYSRNTRP